MILFVMPVRNNKTLYYFKETLNSFGGEKYLQYK